MADKLTNERIRDLQLLRGEFEKGSTERKQSTGVGIGMIVVGIGAACVPFIPNTNIEMGDKAMWGCYAVALAAICLGIYTLKNVGGGYFFSDDGVTEVRRNGKNGTSIKYAEIENIRHLGTRVGGEFLLIMTRKVRMSIILTPEIFEAIESAKKQAIRPAPEA